MKIKRVTYLALGAFVFAASCSKEVAEPDVFDWEDGAIYFRPSISNVARSRAQDMTLDRLESFQVTCFNTIDRAKDANGYISPYFENATFIQLPNYTYVSSPNEEPREWPAGSGLIRFFAFSPSLDVMADGISATLDPDVPDEPGEVVIPGDPEEDEVNDEPGEIVTYAASGSNGYFNLINRSTADESNLFLDYRLGKIRINPDISRQSDFITAEISGERKDFIGGVEISFAHRLCEVELQAWGNGGYVFDIAGVRIGNPVVEGSFVFADDSDPSRSGKWEASSEPVMDKVEYIYGSAPNPQSVDSIFRIDGREHNTRESAASIMGQGGCAMVLPTDNLRWEGLADPNIGSSSYTTKKMYFSILMRVTDPVSEAVVYPYPGGNSGMKTVSYAVDAGGNILTRIYPGPANGTYFTDSGLRNRYVAKEGEQTMDFGWAAVPVDADWKAGKRYVYTLDYSEGIGLHDPADPEPGKPIVGQSPISWGVSVSDWEYAGANDDFNPDLAVP